MKKIVMLMIEFIIIITYGNALELNLEKAKEIALRNYPAYLASMEELKATQSGRWNAYSGLLPSASFQASQTQYNPEQNVGMDTADKLNTYGITVTQPIFSGGKIWLGARIQNDMVKIAKENLRMAKYETLAGVEEQYFSVLQNKQLQEIAELDLEISKTNLEITQAKFASGLISKADLLQIRAEKTNKIVNVLQMKNLYETSKMNLLNYLHIGSIDNIAPIDSTNYIRIRQKLRNLSITEIDNIARSLVDYGLENNPALAISEISVKSSKKSLIIASGNFLPSLHLSYSKNWLKYDYMDDYESSENIILSASLPIFPIMDNITDYSKARHELKKVNYDLQNTEDGIITGIKNQFLTLVSATHSIVAAKASRAQAKESFDQIQERFSQGISSANEFISAQTLYLSTQNQYIQSIYDFHKTKSKLQQQLGTEEDILLQLIDNNI